MHLHLHYEFLVGYCFYIILYTHSISIPSTWPITLLRYPNCHNCPTSPPQSIIPSNSQCRYIAFPTETIPVLGTLFSGHYECPLIKISNLVLHCNQRANLLKFQVVRIGFSRPQCHFQRSVWTLYLGFSLIRLISFDVKGL